MNSLLTINDVSEKLGVTPRTVRYWIEKGYISFIKLPSGALRMKEENLERWVEKREVKKKIA
jgi:excisionase family DNA binding protein